MSSIRILISESHDPYFNLAVEDAIFRNMPTDKRVLFLWRNQDTVVIGRGQNPWKECNTGRMEEDGVKLARRQSGGGAVYQDLGNSIFTFMGGRPGFDKAVTTEIVLTALRTLGINGKASGRNDLVIESEDGDRKFSGSAYREASDRGFHHGTLLLSANLSRLADYLTPSPKKLQFKGFESVRSRVMNLSELLPDIDHACVCDAIRTAFESHYGETVEPERIDPTKMPDLPGFVEVYERQKDWNWNFGKALKFSHTLDERFAWGGVELHLDVKQGTVQSAKLFTDSLFPDAFETATEAMIGKRYEAVELSATASELAQDFPDQADELAEFSTWLRAALA